MHGVLILYVGPLYTDSGILLARNVSAPSPPPTIAALWVSSSCTTSPTSGHSTVRPSLLLCFLSLWAKSDYLLTRVSADIRTWHANIEQHASEGVNKILIGNKSDWSEKRAVTEEQGRELANELGIKFMETSAKINEGVEEAFFTLARSASLPIPPFPVPALRLYLEVPLLTLYLVFLPSRDIKTRLIDSQADASAAPGQPFSVQVHEPTTSQAAGGCC